MVTISDKINHVLTARGLLKRDLARALGVSPQTATDICKGRSSVTLPHLRSLIRFFGLRADFWLDDDRIEPTPADESIPMLAEKIQQLSRTGLLYAEDPATMFERMREIVVQHRTAYVERHGELRPEERQLLGLPEPGRGVIGRVGEQRAN